MVTVRTGSLVHDLRGSIAQQTFGRNQGGLFARERVMPHQDPSADRTQRKNAMTAISRAWSGILTEAQRQTWIEYGRKYLLPDRWGRPKAMSGICHFVRCNAQRYRVNPFITATTAPDEPPGPPPVFDFTADATANALTFDLGTFDYRGNPDELRIYWYAGHQCAAGRNFYNGPWRYVSWNMRDEGAWFYEPWFATHPWGLTEANRVWTRLVAELPDGATSIRHQESTTIVGAV